MIRLLTENDYNEVYQLWERTPGIGLRSMDDSKEGIKRFLKRNPTTNFVAVENNQIVGTVLAGHDGRRGYLYHVSVEEGHRQKSIGRKLIEQVKQAMRSEKITKLALICFERNDLGNRFWSLLGWTKRTDLNYYNLNIEDNNI